VGLMKSKCKECDDTGIIFDEKNRPQICPFCGVKASHKVNCNIKKILRGMKK